METLVGKLREITMKCSGVTMSMISRVGADVFKFFAENDPTTYLSEDEYSWPLIRKPIVGHFGRADLSILPI